MLKGKIINAAPVEALRVIRANKAVTGFMGSKFKSTEYGRARAYDIYSESLDDLVPVFQKLDVSHYICSTELYIPDSDSGYYECDVYEGGIRNRDFHGEGSTIQIAALFAVEKAIIELINKKVES